MLNQISPCHTALYLPCFSVSRFAWVHCRQHGINHRFAVSHWVIACAVMHNRCRSQKAKENSVCVLLVFAPNQSYVLGRHCTVTCQPQVVDSTHVLLKLSVHIHAFTAQAVLGSIVSLLQHWDWAIAHWRNTYCHCCVVLFDRDTLHVSTDPLLWCSVELQTESIER